MMKKLLTCIFLVLFAVNVNAQWYQRLYGVTNINELSEQQLNLAMQLANQKIKTGKTVTLIGLGSFIVGGILVTDGMIFSWNDIDKGLSEAAAGLLIASGGIITAAIGTTIWITGSNRKSSIEVALTRFNTSFLDPFKPPKITGMSLTLNF